MWRATPRRLGRGGVEGGHVIRKLISLERPGRSDFQRACHELGMRPTRLYELSSERIESAGDELVACPPAGTRQGSQQDCRQAEAVIAEAIRDLYKSRQKPSVNRLHKENMGCRRSRLSMPVLARGAGADLCA